jgi:hypothetical protein
MIIKQEKWVNVTFVGKGIKFLKHTNLKVAYKTKHIFAHHLKIDKYANHNKDKFLTRGIYQLNCPDCDKMYFGQTDLILRKYIEDIS